MLRKVIKLVGISIVLLGGLHSCTKFLDKKANDKILSADAINSMERARAALNGCYDGLQDYRYYGRNFIILSEIYADNAVLGSNNNGDFSALYNHSTTAYTQEIAGLWSICYQIINRANTIIERVPLLSDGTLAERNQIVGEALALRALVYLDLVRTFSQPYSIKTGVDSANGDGGHAGVPLILTSGNADSIISPARNTVKEVFTQISKDLDSAQKKIEMKISDRARISGTAVIALRIKLLYSYGSYKKTSQLYVEFKKFKSECVDKGYCNVFSDTAGYMNQWKEMSTSKDVIFYIPSSNVDNNGVNSLGQTFQTSKMVTANTELYTQFVNTDIRKRLYQKSSEVSINKYNGILAQIPILRTTEVYLNLCESITDNLAISANDGFKFITIDYLNYATKGISSTETISNPNISVNELTQKIIEFRRKELAFEGHRLFDLKRRQASIVRKDCQSSNCTITFPSPLLAMPIPAAEINANSNIKQNPGY